MRGPIGGSHLSASPTPACAAALLLPALQLIQKNNIKAVHVLASASKLQQGNWGATPAVALEVAHSAIQFCECRLGSLRCCLPACLQACYRLFES